MNRRLRGGLALVGGFVAAVAAGSVDLQRGAEVEVLGIVELNRYCTANIGSGSAATLIGDDATSWRCGEPRGGGPGSAVIDFERLCRQQFGSDARPRTSDSSSPYAWQCIRND